MLSVLGIRVRPYVCVSVNKNGDTFSESRIITFSFLSFYETQQFSIVFMNACTHELNFTPSYVCNVSRA